jgi:hypothetical protein
MNNRPPTTGDRKGTPARSPTALRELAAEIEYARMLSLGSFLPIPWNEIRAESLKRLWDGGAGGGVETEDAEVRIADGDGAKDAQADVYLMSVKTDQLNLE